MDSTIASWEQQLAAIWDSFDDEAEAPFLAAIDAHLAELPSGSAIVAFEVAASRDSTGHPDLAIPFYRYALDIGLEGERRRRAVIQLASSLRNLGAVEEAVGMLEAERKDTSDYLADELTAFLALCLADVGREREAAGLALSTLAPYLSRYQHSLRNYAGALVGATAVEDVADAAPADDETEQTEQEGSAEAVPDESNVDESSVDESNVDESSVDESGLSESSVDESGAPNDSAEDSAAEESDADEAGSDGTGSEENAVQENTDGGSTGESSAEESNVETDTDHGDTDFSAEAEDSNAEDSNSEEQPSTPEEWTEPASARDESDSRADSYPGNRD